MNKKSKENLYLDKLSKEELNNKYNKALFQSHRIWNLTRESFWSMIAFWLLYIIFSERWSLGAIYIIFTISTFILSIIHLRTYKGKGEKWFAITSLCISSFWLAMFLLGVLIGVIIAIVESA